jgi:signal transduction histidine kinase
MQYGTERKQTMRQTEQAAGRGGAELKRVEVVVDTLASLRGPGESLAEVAHDARNMVTALGLYCDLLQEPGVLTPAYQHYGSELRLVATSSRRLVEKLAALDTGIAPVGAKALDASTPKSGRNTSQRWEIAPAEPITNLAAEVMANRNLLAALAGPSIVLTVDAASGAQPVKLTGEDLTRVLVNLVKNAAEAMPAGGRIAITLQERMADGAEMPLLVLAVEDNGPGIPDQTLERVFESGFSTRSQGAAPGGSWPAAHRGLGLSITRSMIEAAGGQVLASNLPQAGARLEIELPIRVL